MKILELNGIKNTEFQTKIFDCIEDSFSVVSGKFFTESVYNELATSFEEVVKDKVGHYGDLGFKIIIDAKDGNLQVTPGNLWTMAAFKGYYIDPSKIQKDTEEIIIGSEHFIMSSNTKKNLLAGNARSIG